MDLDQLSARVERLERENRRLRLAGGTVVAALLAVALIGAVMPQEIPDVVRARQFYAFDENGKARAGMGSNGFAYVDENGTTRVFIEDLGLIYFSEKGTLRVQMSDAGIAYFDEDGRLRAGMSPAAVFLYDAEGNVIFREPR